MNRDEFRALFAKSPHVPLMALFDEIEAPRAEVRRITRALHRDDNTPSAAPPDAADRAPAASTPASLDVSSRETTPPSAMAAGDFREGRSSGPACGLHPHAGPSPHTSVGA